MVGVLLGAVGCLSPSLPLPPPMAPLVSTSTDGNPNKIHLTGTGVEAGAIIVVYNHSEPDLAKRVGGAEADGLGQWQCDVWARKGDRLSITEQVGRYASPSIDFVVP
jgi:hypothetical protein